jgi:hypothetical protein
VAVVCGYLGYRDGPHRSAARHYNRAIDLSKSGNLDQAIAEYDWAIKDDPKFVKAYNNRAFL